MTIDDVNPVSRLHGADLRLASLAHSIVRLGEVVEFSPASDMIPVDVAEGLSTELYGFAAAVQAMRTELAEVRHALAIAQRRKGPV